MKTNLEYRIKADDQLCFIHIPKTAGTTFTSIIDQKFNVDEICPELVNLHKVAETEEQAVSLTPELVAKYKLIRGHFSYDTIDRFLLKKPLYLTILRNPLDRTISLYEFLKRAKEKGEPEYNEYTKTLRDATDDGLQAFVSNSNPTVKERTSNPQTRILALQPEVDRSDAELLAIAKSNLERFIFVGLTERFHDSIFLLSYIFGWCPATSFYSLRVASSKPSRESLSQAVVDTIIQYNQLDFELYQFAKNLFDDRFTQMLEALQQKYNQLISADDTAAIAALLERHYQQRYLEQKIIRQHAIDFDFQQAMSGTGWHRRNGRHNGLKANTTTFRWTGPSTESTLDFPLITDDDLSIKLRIINAVTPEVLASLKLTVNDCSIALQALFHQNNTTVLQGLIPQAVLQNNSPNELKEQPFTRLTFTVDRTISLKDAKPGNPDQRKVGLAFHRIQIQPAARSLKDSAYLYLLFPLNDPPWNETAQFLEAHVQPTEIVIAPNEFYEKYPQQIHFYSAAARIRAQWVVIHKGQLDAIDPAFLNWTVRALSPVFANEVFVVFSERNDIAKLSDRAPHLQALWAMQPRSLLVRVWQKLKAVLK